MKIGFLGAGHMGQAMLTGLLKSNKYSKADLKIVVASDQSLAKYQQAGFQVSQDWAFLGDCEVVILALRPDAIKSLKQQLTAGFSRTKVLISVAAGVTLAELQAIFTNSAVTRAMPNTACASNQSMTMITAEGSAKANQIATEVFSLLGTTVNLSEAKIHTFIAICGSASAYLYYWLQPLMQLAVAQEVSIEDSKVILTGLLNGVAANIEHSSATLADLQNQVTVPGGTTIAAIKVFDHNNLKQIIAEALAAVVKRSQELE